MITRKSNAKWEGGLKEGKGNLELGTKTFSGQYSFQSRFEEGIGTNPEELIAAAHAGCFSMALSGVLEKEGYKPKVINTEAQVKMDKVGEGFKIVQILLRTTAEVPDIEKGEFDKLAENAKKGCPVSQALSAVEIKLEANLK
ncbi:MAG: OsmC family protein [Bacteroidota bacterium]|jgi:osmotically inducible protein OsmC|nr:OsmC family protein [Bacteroidota bacterium]